MSPAAIVETISLGTPTGSARIAAVAIAVSRAADGEHAVDAALGVQPAHDRGGRVGHRGDRAATVGQLTHVAAGRSGDLLPGDVGLQAVRLAAVPASTTSASTPASSPLRTNAYSSPFVSSVPTRMTAMAHHLPLVSSTAGACRDLRLREYTLRW